MVSCASFILFVSWTPRFPAVTETGSPMSSSGRFSVSTVPEPDPNRVVLGYPPDLGIFERKAVLVLAAARRRERERPRGERAPVKRLGVQPEPPLGRWLEEPVGDRGIGQVHHPGVAEDPGAGPVRVGDHPPYIGTPGAAV